MTGLTIPIAKPVAIWEPMSSPAGAGNIHLTPCPTPTTRNTVNIAHNGPLGALRTCSSLDRVCGACDGRERYSACWGGGGTGTSASGVGTVAVACTGPTTRAKPILRVQLLAA